jgi:hypothetical protein
MSHSVGALRKSIGLSALFFFLTLTFLLLAVGTYRYFLDRKSLLKQRTGNMMRKGNVLKAGGYVGIITAGIAYYCGLSEMLTANDIIQIPTGKFVHRD